MVGDVGVVMADNETKTCNVLVGNAGDKDKDKEGDNHKSNMCNNIAGYGDRGGDEKENKPWVYVAISSGIVHHGHLNVLNAASRLGRVVVGLLTESACLSYKDAPALTYSQRECVFRHIRGVERVVPQTQHDYTDNIRLIKPRYVVSSSIYFCI